MYRLSERVNFKIDEYELSLLRRLAELDRETLSNEIRKVIRNALAENKLLGQFVPTNLKQVNKVEVSESEID